VVTNTLKIMRATMLLSASSNGVDVNVRLVGYGLSVSRYQGIYRFISFSSLFVLWYRVLRREAFSFSSLFVLLFANVTSGGVD
jgi:hypothetical protein